MSTQKTFDVIVYGASGFTGRLVAEYLFQRYGINEGLSWAMAGRNIQKLAEVRDEMGISSSVELLEANGDDAESLKVMAESAQVIISTVGPYQLYGNELIAICADIGCDYVDLCGEPGWMHNMINEHEQRATASGARICFSCGFDSIPFDLGVYFLQQKAIRETGSPITRVKGRVRQMKGSFSGGTLASLKATMAGISEDPSLFAILTNPFSLTPGFTGPEQPYGMEPEYDMTIDAWVAPFIMAAINTRNVHRSNFILNHLYGTDFVYDEMIVAGKGEQGEVIAKAIAADKSFENSDLKPGDGPSKKERDNGAYDVLFVGEDLNGKLLKVSVSGNEDPGYGSTSKMLAESALCLIDNPQLGQGGIWTPGSLMADALIARLQDNAGLNFKEE